MWALNYHIVGSRRRADNRRERCTCTCMCICISGDEDLVKATFEDEVLFDATLEEEGLLSVTLKEEAIKSSNVDNLYDITELVS